jgi:ABC-type polysaccharide/polyol phosphate export permease
MIVVLIVVSAIFVPDARPYLWASIPLGIVFAGLVAGLALLVACLNVLFRDVEHIIAAALLPWFFLTPILWSIDNLPARAQAHPALLDVLRWGNPLAPPIFAIRDAIWSGHAPRLADIVYLLVAAATALALGAFVFRRVDDRIALEL